MSNLMNFVGMPDLGAVFFNRHIYLSGVSDWNEISQLGKLNIEMLIANAKHNKAEGEKVIISDVDKGIVKLEEMLANATEKPYLLSLRSPKYFKIGDSCLFYVGLGVETEHLKTPSKIKGLKTPFAWREIDILANFENTQVKAHFKGKNELYPGEDFSVFLNSGYGSDSLLDWLNYTNNIHPYNRPEILKESDYIYLSDAFKKDPSFLSIWLKNINNKLKDFNPDIYRKDLEFGKTF